jgi:hypothetical protein
MVVRNSPRRALRALGAALVSSLVLGGVMFGTPSANADPSGTTEPDQPWRNVLEEFCKTKPHSPWCPQSGSAEGDSSTGGPEKGGDTSAGGGKPVPGGPDSPDWVADQFKFVTSGTIVHYFVAVVIPYRYDYYVRIDGADVAEADLDRLRDNYRYVDCHYAGLGIVKIKDVVACRVE